MNGELNLFRRLGCEPKEGDTTPFHELLEFLTQDEKEILPWILDWLAYPLKHLGTKLYTCLTMWSVEHGVGKSLLGYRRDEDYRPLHPVHV